MYAKISEKKLSAKALGNYTSYSPTFVNSDKKSRKICRIAGNSANSDISDKEQRSLKSGYKRLKIELKKKIGEKVCRVGWCGTRVTDKHLTTVNVVQGEQGNIYYQNMMRCGSVWFCPDCMFKIMKARANELYDQLKIYKDNGKQVMFGTFTLQHKFTDRLDVLHKDLLGAFNFANKHRRWREAIKDLPVEYLRALEVLHGGNGWHPHLHCVFIGDEGVMEIIGIFETLYKKYLSKKGYLINKHTVGWEVWNGKLNDMTDYMFKGMIEQEILTGALHKKGKGKTFFELVTSGNNSAVDEYIAVMKGKRQFHHSENFFTDVAVREDEEIIKEDVPAKLLFKIPRDIYEDINSKGISLHFLNEYEYGGLERAIPFLELYDCDTSFLTVDY